MGGKRVVVGRSCGLQVHVLPEVSYRPTDVGAERERSDTRSLQRGRVSQQLLPRRGCGLDARRGELGGVVPDGVLVGALEPDPVELAVVGDELVPRCPVVGRFAPENGGEWLDCTLLGQGEHGAGVRDECHLWRRATGYSSVYRRVHVASLAAVDDVDPGLSLERRQHSLEVLLLGTGPLGPERDRAANVAQGRAGG